MFAQKKEYVPAVLVKEFAAELVDDPLLCGNQESDERLIRSFQRIWSDTEGRWILPNNDSRQRIINAALRKLSLNSISNMLVSWCGVQVVEFNNGRLKASLCEDGPGVWTAEITSHDFDEAGRARPRKVVWMFTGNRVWASMALAMQLADNYNIHWGSRTL